MATTSNRLISTPSCRHVLFIHERRLKKYHDNRERLVTGKINCIPTPFNRIQGCFPGIQQQKYYLVTGNTKSAKTSIVNYLFAWYPIMYAWRNPGKARVKIFYFSLEMSASQLIDKLTCLWLHVKKRVTVSPDELNSTSTLLPGEIINWLSSKEYHEFFSFLESNVIFLEDYKSPSRIRDYCKNYALANGKVFTRKGTTSERDPFGLNSSFDHYEQNDIDEYRIIIVDHYGLLQRESGLSLRETIQLFSSRDCVELRNHYNYIIVGVMQQNAEKQANDSVRMNRLTPSIDGLAECKSVAQDIDMAISIFNPWYFEKTNWMGYDISLWRDKIRFIDILLNRNGPTNHVLPVHFVGACGHFSQVPLPSDPTLKELQDKLFHSREK